VGQLWSKRRGRYGYKILLSAPKSAGHCILWPCGEGVCAKEMAATAAQCLSLTGVDTLKRVDFFSFVPAYGVHLI
jgi:hypothetical protein